MKNIRLLLTCVFFLSLSNMTQAADRCEGKLPPDLLRSEYISTLYVDLLHHSFACEYRGTEADYHRANAKIRNLRTKYQKCILKSQEDVIAQLGHEDKFYELYAAVGNQLSYLDIEDPCGRVFEITDLIAAKNAGCQDEMVEIYYPYFDSITAQYEAKSKRPLRRLCD